jgi:hypothetical protein
MITRNTMTLLHSGRKMALLAVAGLLLGMIAVAGAAVTEKRPAPSGYSGPLPHQGSLYPLRAPLERLFAAQYALGEIGK